MVHWYMAYPLSWTWEEGVTVSVRFVGSGDSFGSGGRFQTCILVDAPGRRFTIDFGTSSLIALTQQGIAHNSIDAILLTHMSREMLAHVHEIPEECAADGLVVEL